MEMVQLQWNFVKEILLFHWPVWLDIFLEQSPSQMLFVHQKNFTDGGFSAQYPMKDTITNCS
jgi:hypothetical protein